MPLRLTSAASRDARDARAAAVAEFLGAKGSLRVHEAILCVLYWLDRETPGPVRAGEIALLYPHHDGRRLPSAAQELRHHVERGLAESLGEGLYRITPLGRLVVDALPDRVEVARLRGLRRATPRGVERGAW